MHRLTWLSIVLAALPVALLLPGCPSATTATDDSGARDVGVGVDTGVPPIDTGVPPIDTGVPPEDTGVPPEDTGVSPVDTGVPTDAAIPTDAATPSPCPAALPDPTSACSTDGLICEYGVRTCLSRAECTGGAWAVSVPRCPPPPTGGCPATRDDAQASPCAGDEGALCAYDGLVCTCTSCPNPYPLCMVVDPPVWACEAPNADPECPAAQPLLGGGCAMDAQICDYGCESGERRVCAGGAWTAGSAPGGCPRSTRRAKRDIEYLEPADVDALATEVERTRLATYEYIDPALAGRRHLGFILEDQPGSYSVDPERSQVDLYGYTSMLVAAVQSQQRRVDALEREVAELREARARHPRAARPRAEE